jgi:hypothetical protein
MAEYVSRGSAGRILQLITVVIAAIIILHIIFVLLSANPGNTIVSTDASWAGTLAAWFKNLFTPSNYKLSVVLNYGLAALVWLFLGRVLGAGVDRI